MDRLSPSPEMLLGEKATEKQADSLSWETLERCPELTEQALDLDTISFPEYIARNWTSDNFLCLLKTFPEDVIIFPDETKQKVLAVGYSAPIHLEDGLPRNGWEGAVSQIISDYRQGKEANALVSYSASVSPEARGLKISGKILDAFKEHASAAGYTKLVVPSRPTGKVNYPNLTMEEYFQLTDPETGLHTDPWVRTHQRHGGKIVGVGKNSHVVKNTDGSWPSLQQWEKWTGMEFPEEGEYVIPGGNALLKIENGIGKYCEDCIWVQYDLENSEDS